MKKIKLTTGESRITISPPIENKTNSTTACMCHMIREMGDCKLNEVVKQVKQNKLW